MPEKKTEKPLISIILVSSDIVDLFTNVSKCGLSIAFRLSLEILDLISAFREIAMFVIVNYFLM